MHFDFTDDFFSSLLISLFFKYLSLYGGVLTELSEEVTHDECSQQVEEKDFPHKPEIDVWHQDVAVETLTLEVGCLGPDQDCSVEDHEG